METITDYLDLNPEQEAKLQTVGGLTDEGNVLAVVDPDTHLVGTDLAVRLQTKIREIEDIRDHQLEPVKKAKRAIEETRKRIVGFFDVPINALRWMKKDVDGRCVAWRKEERRKAEIEAERKRAAEAKKIEAAKVKEEKIAAGLEKKGLDAEAAEIRDKVAMTPVAAPVTPTPRISVAPGAHVKIVKKPRVNQKAQTEMLKKAVEAWNATPNQERIVPGNWWVIDMDALEAFGQKTDGMVTLPGVEWYDDESTATRRRR